MHATSTFHVMHLIYSPPPPPQKKIFHHYFFQFLSGRLYKYPGEVKNKGCAKFWGANKVHYGKRGSGVTVLRKRDEIREVRLL